LPGRLDSWKAVASYLGRSDKTVRRWEEKEGLPIHRLHHEGKAEVIARIAGARVPHDATNFQMVLSPDGKWLATPLTD
jgi:hypothetical protein